jgi:hypothetical protein
MTVESRFSMNRAHATINGTSTRRTGGDSIAGSYKALLRLAQLIACKPALRLPNPTMPRQLVAGRSLNCSAASRA